MQIYNSQSRHKETFVPLHEGKVGIYACGPTVYNYFHIGNARPFITFDVLRRYLEHKGYEVTFVQNFTDIDDKMIKRANEEGITVKELGERFIAEYFKDAQALGIRPATVHPKATEHIAADHCPGAAAHRQRSCLCGRMGTYTIASPQLPRVWQAVGAECWRTGKWALPSAWTWTTEKESPADFALWKAQKPGEPAWESPWGMGRPGLAH